MRYIITTNIIISLDVVFIMSDAGRSATLPPLEWLRVFEAAARQGNFTAAAAELGLTQAAVSQRMRNLEAHLGTPLFIRLPRGVELTTEGEAYAPHVRSALAALKRSTADLFSAARRKLSIAATSSVLQLWIAPRLPMLLRQLPNLQISLVTVQRSVDYSSANAHLEVRFGDGAWPGYHTRKMFDETLAPVAAPSLLRPEQQDWRRLPQIAISGPRDGWLDWAAAAEVAPPKSPSLRFDTFAQALSAAVSGAGVLLGSLSLIAEEIEAESLVRLPEPSVRMKNGYWLTWASSNAAYRDQEIILDSLCDPP